MSYPSLERVLGFFTELSAIPRTSGNEAEVAKYLTAFAAKRGLFSSIDAEGNVLIKKPGTDGDTRPSVILQAHMDMVGEKASGSDHDFAVDGIKLVYDGDILHADGTTLGADNGIGLCTILAMLDSDELNHPPLECVFTVAEETGLFGAAAFDFASLEGRRYLNLDSEGEGIATVSCAGGVRCDIILPVPEKNDAIGTDIRISVDGLAGGHSGEDINKRRTNGCLLLANILKDAMASVREAGQTAELVSFSGGSKDNAIPRGAEAVVRTTSPDILCAAVDDVAGERLQYLSDRDMLCRMSFAAAVPTGNIIGDTLLDLITSLPCGVIEMDPAMPDFVRTSANIGIVSADSNCVKLTLSARSSSDAALDVVMENIEKIASDFGGSSSFRSRYPGWARMDDSAVRPVYAEAVQEVFGTEAKFCSIHAGLECGIVSRKVPDMDMISIGPVITNMHSPEETVSLSSVERFVRIVCIMLERM